MVRISAKHQCAHKVNLVPIGAQPFRVAPISTKPAPDIETDLLGDELLPLERKKNDRPEAAALVEYWDSELGEYRTPTAKTSVLAGVL